MSAVRAGSPRGEPARTTDEHDGEGFGVRTVPVLVVGGSLTGLSAAVLLAWHGVPCLLVERRDGVLPHPRLRGLLPRAVEVFRQVGLENAIRAACPDGAGSGDLVSVRARTLTDVHEPLVERGDEEADEDRGDAGPETASPCRFAPLGQDELEALLLDRARELGADVAFGTELLHLDQDDRQVTATVRGPAAEVAEVRARYVVAADGASSGLRRRLGVRCSGPGTLFHMATLHVQADLRPALRGRPLGMAYLDRPAPGTTLGPLDGSGTRWFFATSCRTAPGGRPHRPTPQECAGWLRTATGLPDLDVRLLPQTPGSDGLPSTFPIGARVADAFRVRRVLLAGDAAHQMPPTGGLGGQTAVEDVHNLAWKLALVLRGSADPSLLDTYGTERRPVARRAVEQSVARARSRWRLPMPDSALTTTRQEDFYALVLGNQYRSPAVRCAPDDAAPLLQPSRLTGAPGSRAPHIAVAQDGGEPLSTLDLYGRDFVLLAGPDGDSWQDAASSAGRALGVAVDTYHLDEELAAPHGLPAGGALLVRPDGYVAWRSAGHRSAADAHARLRQALGALLGLAPAPAPSL
ncbi:FAD-dependent monooxygenase [Streptomyces sp. DSM 42041]|uniref:FAD-dependent monooxygenase n=1 Tax=Streptomyces hazeniae TaxID=3075538 RepID=A0ABU2NMH8_9ACTN|nr:FAD-dependent monooxygenase [Streptomyces sp. DSM 42041]MDT0378166.1 FAD-dependent monooxygenase [Streptomyces sp. DSM 42041]